MNPLTLEQAKQLTYGQILYSRHWQNADGTPCRYKVNGQVKVWKSERNALRVRVPVKRGLYEFGYVEQDANGVGNLSDFSLDEN